MHSIRFKITAITVGVILAILLTIFCLCYSSVKEESDRQSVEMMQLIGQDTQNTLDEYFVSIEQSVGMAANEAIDSLDSVVLVECGAVGSQAGQAKRTPEQTARLDAYLAEHCALIQKIFENVASHTHGINTYYYCISPEISETEHGFFYSRVGKAGFVAQEPLDARTLDPNDIEHTTWYYTPIQRGRPSWVGPYTAHFLGEMWTCSYLVPIYNAGTLIGVLGMDIPLDTLVAQVEPIRVYKTGFASLCDVDGRVYSHPTLPLGTLPELSKVSVSRELLHDDTSGDTLIRYYSGGVKRQICFTTLRNGMKLVITAPVREINSSWLRLIRFVLIVTLAAIVVYAVVLMFAMRQLTRPLRRLTAASRRLAAADYDVELNYKGRDEVGELTEAFRQMRDKQKEYIDDLNRRVYTDDLTGLPNLRAFFSLAETDRNRMLAEGKQPAMLYFNLIGMKHFNRQYGFDEGNRLICAFAELLERHYGGGHLCRIGQDHFAAVTDEDGLEDTLRDLFEDCKSMNDGKTLPVRVGIYRNSLEPVDVSAACDRAKYACDLLRGSYISNLTYYESGMREQVEQTRYVVSHLDQALAENWIQVYYQPIIRAGNGMVCDSEALSRWIDPERGFLSPADFIPALEGSGQIYKLDLYVIDRVLEKMQLLQKSEENVIPCSVNLSRSDFDSCDMVEEIRKRVDAAGVSRSMISIEITESIIGSDFDFIKEQVARFQELGFPVWMDDFGSGYSSLDVLQSIRFDLLKFDMSFMRKLDEGDDGKIILTKLMEMATALGVDTLCEGVETEAQVHFLQEIGCSKLQGYYFCKPLPLSEIMEKKQGGQLPIEYENPAETDYYEAVGRVNLYDLGVMTADDSGAFRHSFSTLPMGIIEVRGDSCRFMRCNQSYRDFFKRFFGIDLSSLGSSFGKYDTAFMYNVVNTCCELGVRSFYDEKMPDGSVVHSFARRVGVNPVTGSVAVAVAVLSISERDESATYADIARALAADYYNIYVVDLDTDRFTEYRSTVGGEELAMERHGEQFFESAKRDSVARIYKEDLAPFVASFTKENIIRELDEQGVFTITYRLIDTGAPTYVNMKITRMPGGNRIIMGISIVDSQMKQKEADMRLRQEQLAFGRLAALSGNYIVNYSVDPETGHFTEYSAAKEYADYGIAKEGEDFFEQLERNSPAVVDPADLAEYMQAATKENMLREIRQHGLFAIHYRLLFNGRYRPVSLRAALVKEPGGEKLIVGINTLEA